MNKDFEKLPEIAARIKKHSMFFNENKNQYGSVGRASDTQKVADINFVGGAWLVYQEQQRKIDEKNKLINAILLRLHVAYMSDGNSSIETLNDEIKELLK